MGDRRYTKAGTQESKGEHRVLLHSMCACLSGHKAQLLVVYMSHPQKTTSHLRGQVPRLPSLSHAGAYARSTSKPCSAFSLRLFTRGAPARWLVCKWGWECHGPPPGPEVPREPRTEPSGGRKPRCAQRPFAVTGHLLLRGLSGGPAPESPRWRLGRASGWRKHGWPSCG